MACGKSIFTLFYENHDKTDKNTDQKTKRKIMSFSFLSSHFLLIVKTRQKGKVKDKEKERNASANDPQFFFFKDIVSSVV